MKPGLVIQGINMDNMTRNSNTSTELTKPEDTSQQLQDTTDIHQGVVRLAKQVVRAQKLGTEKRVDLLHKLVRSHKLLVELERTLTGRDSVAGSTNVGVIIIPSKSDDWIKDANREIDKAKELINLPAEGAQVKDDEHSPPKEGAEAPPS